MAQRKGSKKRSSKKILDAFQIAEREEARKNGVSDDSGSEDDLKVIDGVMNARKFTKNGSNDDSDSALEDEELDSDEALGSDDDYDVLNSKFSQTLRDKTKKQKQRAKQIRRGDLNEDDDDDGADEEYDSIDEGQLVTLSEAWDMDERDQKKHGGDDVVFNDDWESEEESASESESESESEDEESEDDVFDVDEDENVDLANTVSHVTSQIKKPARERRQLVTEATDENEFSVPAGNNKLSLNDMIAAVDSSISKDAILIEQPEIDDDGTEKSRAMAVPLPTRIQQRHDREAAYEMTKEELKKWNEAIRENRDAEHLLFPLNAEESVSGSVSLRTDVEPQTELEKRIHGLLEQSALVDDSKEATFEQIATAKLTKDEMMKRTNELRQMRELMFRDEQRAKRIKKIKSKLYHKIKKRERMRNEGLVDGSDDESDPEDHDMKRAQERMSLKHKTNSSWARSMIKSGLSKDAANRGELEEMLRQGERLKSKQLGYNEGEQSDNGALDIENEYAKDELRAEKDESSRIKLGKGVLNMDFMRSAEERQRKANLRELEQLRKLERGEDLDEFKEAASAVDITKNQGRRVYTPAAQSMQALVDSMNEDVLQDAEDDEAKSLDRKLSKKFSVVDSQKVNVYESEEENDKEKDDDKDESDESNPWLAASGGKKSSKFSKVDKNSTKLVKAAAKVAKSKKRTSSERDVDDDAFIDMQETLMVGGGRSRINDSDGESDEDEGASGSMFHQKNLIREAFAGDDVVDEFEKEKRQVVMEEDDREEDATIPGWGDWTGSGAKPKKRKFTVKIDGVMQADKRKDKNLKNVIINEKVNKKNLKYQSALVPYPYESREQYERALRMPVGQEWTARETHQKLTKPRISTKQGVVIDPLKAPFK